MTLTAATIRGRESCSSIYRPRAAEKTMYEPVSGGV
jgi:hypothetical protein